MNKELIKSALQKSAFMGKMLSSGLKMGTKAIGRKGAVRAADIGMSAARGAAPGAAVGALAGGVQGMNDPRGSFLGGAAKGALTGAAIGGAGAGALRGARHGASAMGYKGAGKALGGVEKTIGLGRGTASLRGNKMSMPGVFSGGYKGTLNKAASSYSLAQRILSKRK